PGSPPTPPPGSGPAGSSATAGSADPNAKTGPAGFGPAHFLAADSVLPYRIDFENEATATAPAQRVLITDALDASLDRSSFGWAEVGLGHPPNPHPAGREALPAARGHALHDRTFQVEIELSFESQSGLLTAVFQSIDRATSLPPDVLTG